MVPELIGSNSEVDMTTVRIRLQNKNEKIWVNTERPNAETQTELNRQRAYTAASTHPISIYPLASRQRSKIRVRCKKHLKWPNERRLDETET